MTALPDHSEEDIGNIVSLEHINLQVPDQAMGVLFYLVGLGLTRDPYLNIGPENMWANVGEQQFHLPGRAPAQAIAGTIGLVVPDLERLHGRLKAIEERLKGTRFAFSIEDGCVAVTCPWGNRFRCHEPGPMFGDMALGLPYIEFDARPGSAKGIARFYAEGMGAPSEVKPEGGMSAARVGIGRNQWLLFRESDKEIPPYDGHHVAVYVANFSGPYGFLKRRNLLMEDVRNHQFRFKKIVDPESGDQLFQLEHEVRSLRHPMYGRIFVNRDPTQTQRNYRRGRDALSPFIE